MKLTDREMLIIFAFCNLRHIGHVATYLRIPLYSVKTYMVRIHDKIGTSTPLELILWAHGQDIV